MQRLYPMSLVYRQDPFQNKQIHTKAQSHQEERFLFLFFVSQWLCVN